jgi:Uncharacterized protein conserved in bacteria
MMRRSTGHTRGFFLRKTLASLCLLLLAACASAQEGAQLTADRLEYAPGMKRIRAIGNVQYSSVDGELAGDEADGTEDGRDILVRGNVRGTFYAQSLDVTCETMRIRQREGETRTIVASGDVSLLRGDDAMTSDAATWLAGSDNYRAIGNVLGTFGSYSIDADEVARNGDAVEARNIRRYADTERGVTLSAAKANGTIAPDGALSDLTAEGQVVLTMRNEGEITHITGNKGVYSLARGTVVISGNAAVEQAGRNLRAGSVVYHLDTGRVEALGRPTMTITLPD